MIVPIREDRENSKITKKWPRVNEEPPLGTTWVAILLRDGVNGVVTFPLPATATSAQ